MNFSAIPGPVIVVSPALRSGTTLVQRLLCSAPNTLIYGDTVGQELDFLARYAQMKLMMLGHHEAVAGPQREAVLAGQTDDFITSLAPSLAVSAAQWRDAAVAWLDGCAQEAQRAQRPVWGWKFAGCDGSALTMLDSWLPEARWILVERNLADCCRSAKAAGLLRGEAEAKQFLATSEAFLRAWTDLLASRNRQTLRISYEAMLADRAGTVAQLEAFTGAAGIDQAVFDRKINEPGARWNPPMALSEEEASILSDSPQSSSFAA